LRALFVATHSRGEAFVPAFRISYAIEHERGLGSASGNPRYGIRIMAPPCNNQIEEISDRGARVLLGCDGCDRCTQWIEVPFTLQRTESAEDSVGRRAIWRQYSEQSGHQVVEAIISPHETISIREGKKILGSAWLKRNRPLQETRSIVPTTLP